MITLNDYLYSGDTLLRILHQYSSDLRRTAAVQNNAIDMAHSAFLLQLTELLEHNDFLTAQSQKLQEFYRYLAQKYPFLAFTFKGRIKSLIRAEEKFNGYIIDAVTEARRAGVPLPTVKEMGHRLTAFRDLIAYRVVISLPPANVKAGVDRAARELDILYEIANSLIDFLEEEGFSPQPAHFSAGKVSPRLSSEAALYYRDYIENPKSFGYRSLHVTFRDPQANCLVEFQLRTKEMDDEAEIGDANHTLYQKNQEIGRSQRDLIPEGECSYFDEAFERIRLLQELELNKLDVNMFGAIDNRLINDGCGLFRGRLILPYEHLSRFQHDIHL